MQLLPLHFLVNPLRAIYLRYSLSKRKVVFELTKHPNVQKISVSLSVHIDPTRFIYEI